MILLVNKDNIFNENDISNFEMIEYENFKEDTLFIERETFRHYEMLKAHLRIEGIEIDILDAYRSLEMQENIFLKYMSKYGIDDAESICAMPGTTDHHTGQAIDICFRYNDMWMFNEDEMFEHEEVLLRIHKVLKYFGFVLRYPKGKEHITGFKYEPWHIRYVGEDVAMKIGDMTLEEYLNK